MLLDAFYAIALDVVSCTLSLTTDILGPDAHFDQMVMVMSHERIKKWTRKVRRRAAPRRADWQ